MPHDPARRDPDVEIVIPVFNEEEVLERSVRRVHRFLGDGFPFTWRIVIADNASTDATGDIGRRLAAESRHVDYLRVERRGRGTALKEAWSRSAARAVAYMDVDLSTDLRALLPLVSALLSGHSDVAIGTRLAPGAHVVRGLKRELISRAYNRILHVALHARFSDAQCGFKALSARALRDLLPDLRDGGWFFDTELLVLAQRRGLRIHEVPVDWVEDPRSSVALVRTAAGDLRSVARLTAAGPVARFLAVGVASTIAYALLYLALRPALGAMGANALALALTAVTNTQANRRLTFRIRGRRELVRHHLAGALVYVLTLGLTAGAMAVLHGVDPGASRPLEVLVLVLAGACATVTRYVALKTWVFARRRRRPLPTVTV